MKTLVSILMLSASFLNAADWMIHGALGTNPGIGFSRISSDGTHIEQVAFMYGVDPTFSFNADEWCVSYGNDYSVYVSGSVLTIDGSWGTVEIPYNSAYGSCSSLNWSIEDGAPTFNGGSSQVAPETPGEYWIDWSGGVIRISTSQPPDFGKYLSDGSINPSWTAAKRGYAKGHNKQPLPTTK